ncbi:MAG: glycosyltransferase family 4 protein [Pseudanabaenaceae cyanobacterium]
MAHILVLAWEFPPRIVGGISRHVAELYPEVVKLGHEVHLITIAVPDQPSYEIVDGIHLYRVAVSDHPHFPDWVAGMNQNMQDTANQLALRHHFDLIHAHDWLVGKAGISISTDWHIPLVATIHATEYGRNNGIHNDAQRYIHLQEIALTQAACQVIVCSEYMKGEVNRALGCDPHKVQVIFNGINLHRIQKSVASAEDLRHWRLRFADPEEAIVYYVGRITYEKGIYLLLNAAPKVLQALDDRVKFIIVGTGNAYSILLQRQAWDLGIYHKTIFTGFIAEPELYKLQAVANCAVFPSLYEPFGIVALESFAAGVPVVVSDTGGLPEVVKHGQTGIVTKVNDADSLAHGILKVLQDPDYARLLTEQAKIDLKERFDWAKLAQATVNVYQLAIASYQVG